MLEEMEERVVEILGNYKTKGCSPMELNEYFLSGEEEILLKVLRTMEQNGKMYFSWNRRYVLLGGKNV